MKTVIRYDSVLQNLLHEEYRLEYDKGCSLVVLLLYLIGNIMYVMLFPNAHKYL